MALDSTRPVIYKYTEKPDVRLASTAMYIPVLPHFHAGEGPHFTGGPQ